MTNKYMKRHQQPYLLGNETQLHFIRIAKIRKLKKKPSASKSAADLHVILRSRNNDGTLDFLCGGCFKWPCVLEECDLNQDSKRVALHDDFIDCDADL